MTQGICALCKQDKKLIKSHVIPLSLLRLLSTGATFDGQIITVHPDRPGKPIPRPGGSYSYLLCERCDNNLGIYDEYIKTFILNSALIQHPQKLWWLVEDVDQHKLKLFCMSYIWRASLSDLKEFNEVSLGTRHEESLRDMISSENAGDPNTYAVIAGKYTSRSNEELFSKIVMVPKDFRHKEIRFYEISLPRLFRFNIKVDQRNLPDGMLSRALGSSTQMLIYNKGEYDESAEYRSLMEMRGKATAEENRIKSADNNLN